MGIGADPDARALHSARDRLAEGLASFGVSSKALTPAQLLVITRLTLMEWARARAENWSQDRSISGVGKPDAYTLGFAGAVLPVIAREALPWDRPVGDWSKEEVAHLIATGCEAIEEQRVRTLENEEIPA